MSWIKLLKDPLLHFAAAGAIMFAAYAIINRGEMIPPATDPIQISEGDIRWLKDTFSNQWRRPPTEDELSGLIAGFLEEELFAREAKALGLDQNDTIVRRRLAQKLMFLVDDTSRIVEPANAELRRFYNVNAKRFQVEARITFTQLFFNPEKRQHAESDARAALMSISQRVPTAQRQLAIQYSSRTSSTRSTSRQCRTCLVLISLRRSSRWTWDGGLARLNPITVCILSD